MSKLMPALLGAALSSGSGGGSDLEPVIITAESNTTINGYQVPALTSENIQAIYNGIVAGKEVVVTDATENMHFKVNQADTVSDEIFISYVYFDVMILQYDESGNITYKEIESLPAGGTTGQVLKKSSNTDYDTEWGDAGGDNSPIGFYYFEWDSFPISTTYDMPSNIKTFFQNSINDAYSKGKNAICFVKLTTSNDANNQNNMLNQTCCNLQTKPELIVLNTGTMLNYFSSYNDTALRGARIRIGGSWNGNTFTLSYAYWDGYNCNVLPKDNYRTYTPTNPYNPATKKYVDDSIASAITTTLGGDY